MHLSCDVSFFSSIVISCRFLHRDLAARNILLHRLPNEEVIAKISDFGLAKYVLCLKCNFRAVCSLIQYAHCNSFSNVVFGNHACFYVCTPTTGILQSISYSLSVLCLSSGWPWRH